VNDSLLEGWLEWRIPVFCDVNLAKLAHCQASITYSPAILGNPRWELKITTATPFTTQIYFILSIVVIHGI